MPGLDWRCSWDDRSGSGLRLQQTLAEQCQRHGPVQLALNLDGFNSLTCSLVPWLEPVFVGGGSLSANRRRDLPWGSTCVSASLRIPIGTVLLFSSAMPMCSAATTSLNCSASWRGFRTMWIPQQLNCLRRSSVYRPRSADSPHHGTGGQGLAFSHWRQVLDVADAQGWSVGLVGSPPAAQKEAYNAGDGEDSLLKSTGLIDLRGQTSLMQLAGACRQAKAVISVDAGPLHIAAAVGTPTYAIVGNDADGVGASPVRLWMPRCSNVTRSVSPASCSACADNRFRNDACLVDGHPCMAAIQPSEVIDWLNVQSPDIWLLPYSWLPAGVGRDVRQDPHC